MGVVEVGREWWTVCVTGSADPLPTTMQEEVEGLREARLPGEDDSYAQMRQCRGTTGQGATSCYC